MATFTVRNFVRVMTVYSLSILFISCNSQSGEVQKEKSTSGESKGANSKSTTGLYDRSPAEELDSLVGEIQEGDVEFEDEWLDGEPFSDEDYEEESVYSEEAEEILDSIYETQDIEETELILNRERLLSSSLMTVIIPALRSERDSVLLAVEKRMSLKSPAPIRKIILERWFSPVNHRGYKFNRRKLLVYGLDQDEPIELYYYANNYYIALDEAIFELEETVRSLPFEITADSALAKYLLTYEN